MSRSRLQHEILAALQLSPREPISERTLRGVVASRGIQTSPEAFEAACLELIEAGALDFERGGSHRRYRLPPNVTPTEWDLDT